MTPKPRKAPARNQRRSGARQRRDQNLLEVSIRSRLANRQRNRRILLWISKLVLLVGLVGGTFYGGRYALRRFLWENPEYNLAVVEIRNDGTGVTREMVMGAAGLQLGQNVFAVSLAKARDGIAELPQVERVELRRVLPNKITVDLTERRPVAWLADSEAADPTASEKSYLIDARGTLFKPKRQLPEYLRLPVIHGVQPENFLPGETVSLAEVQAALRLVRLCEDSTRLRLQSIDLSKGYCMVATNANRQGFYFKFEDIDRQFEKLGYVLDAAEKNHLEIQTVNLIPERNIPITSPPAPEAEAAAAVAKKDTDNEAKTADRSSEVKASSTSSRSSKGSSHTRKTGSSTSSESRRTKRSSRSSNSDSSGRSDSKAEPTVRRALPVKPGPPMATAVAP